MRKSLLEYGVLAAAVLIISACTSSGLMPDRADELSQVPITEQPSGKTIPGKFVWRDLITPDLESAATFYHSLFGWTLEYRQGYAIVRNQGRLIARIIEIKTQRENNAGLWIPTVSVGDIAAAAERVESNGGKVLKGPTDPGKRGKALLIRDSRDANLVLLESLDGDPVDISAELGDWLWDEVWTTTPEQTEAFYSAVLGYDQVLPGESYDVFIKNGVWRAGMRHVGESMENLLWVPVVRVEDPDKTALSALELGGYVLKTPDVPPGIGNTALIADPTGALLIVQRWSGETEVQRPVQ